MMLRLSLGRAEAADALETAVEHAIRDTRTRDLGGKASTVEMADAIVAAIEA
jgi:isocitrate/isopropylmalate dehydrogenase